MGETVLLKVPMKRGPLSGDANFSDLGNLEVETRVGADVELFPTSRVSRPNSAYNKSYDGKRELSATVWANIPMKRGRPSGDPIFVV